MLNPCKISILENTDKVSIKNQADKFVKNNDIKGIEALANNIYNEKLEICLDSIKTILQIGEQKPELIDKYIFEFLRLIQIENAELNYYALKTLLTLVNLKPDEIYEDSGYVIDLMEMGEEKEADIGLQILSIIATKNDKYNLALFPYMVNYLRNSENHVFAKYAEYILKAATATNKELFNGVLTEKKIQLKGDDLNRVEEVLKKLSSV